MLPNDTSDRLLDEDMLRHYSAALDHIYELRGVLAVEVCTIRHQVLQFVSLPIRARNTLQASVIRMRHATRGNTSDYYPFPRKTMLTELGAPATLTRYQWEHRR